jgi:hypothetical protein
MHRFVTVAILSLLGLSIPIVVGAAPASAATVPAIHVNSATLIANGAAVRLELTATCGQGDDGLLDSTITQAVGDRIAQGTKPMVLTCTGEPQLVSALAVANVNGASFRVGVALATAHLSDCPGANCTQAETDEVVRIQK